MASQLLLHRVVSHFCFPLEGLLDEGIQTSDPWPQRSGSVAAASALPLSSALPPSLPSALPLSLLSPASLSCFGQYSQNFGCSTSLSTR